MGELFVVPEKMTKFMASFGAPGLIRREAASGLSSYSSSCACGVAFHSSICEHLALNLGDSKVVPAAKSSII